MRQTSAPLQRLRQGRALAAFLLSLIPAVAGPARAGEWTLEFDPLLMDAYGHDQHVLTVGDAAVDLVAGTRVDSRVAVTVDTNSGGAYRGSFQYREGKWAWGVEYLWFSTSQDQVAETATAAGPLAPVIFQTADRLYVSTGPNEVLFFNVLEDTDLAIWTADLYGARILTQEPDSDLSLVLGLRIADFDNDYRAVTGIEGQAGTRQDASSNYSAMYGPLVGLTAEIRRGRHSFEGYLSQSVVLGTADLSLRTRDFLGPLVAEPLAVVDQAFQKSRDVAIPISELRLQWRYRLTRALALGLTVDASSWWDVPVPPGVIPGGGPRLHENTIVFLGLGGGLRLAF